MKHVSSLTLRTRVLLLLTLIFFIFAGLATFKAFQNFAQIKQSTRSEFQWAASWIESEQHRHLAQSRLVAFVAMNQIRKGLTDKVCRRGVVGTPGLDPEFGQFALADPDGNISCNSIPWLNVNNVADEAYFKEAKTRVDEGFIDESSNRNPHQYAAVMARAMRDNGTVLKVILVAMDFSWVKEEVDQIHLPSNGHLLIVDARGTLIAGSQNLADKVDTSLMDTPFYRQVLAASDKTFEGLSLSGEKSLIVSRTFISGSGQMRVIIDIPQDAMLRPAYRELVFTLLINTLVFILILALSYFRINQLFIRKLLIIEAASNQLAAGNLSARIQLQGHDELDHLAQSFDAMADALQAKEIELKNLNDELYRVNRSLLVLSAGNKSLLFAKTEQELLDRICREIVEKGGYLAAWIGFSGPTHDLYLRTAASYSKDNDESVKIDWNTAGNGLHPVIKAVRENKVLVINDTSHESVHKQLGEQAAKFGYRSIIILPLHLEGIPFGALILTAYRENEFGDTQVEYLKETASDTSFGIEMLRTKQDRNRLALLGEQHELALRNSLEDALRAISLTIEMRDPYTAGHQHRVADLAKALAHDLGMSDEEIHGIYLAAVVHDIGKINIPAEILVKPGKLSEIEYALVKTHVEASYEILKGIKFPWPIANMVHQHHERLDGTGYPLGLKDGDILFGARIMAVADVVEAMSSHRPYRAGLGIALALNEIESGKGKVYDAAVVESCVRLFREGHFTYTSHG
jgi:HD-GYP domain-containing protein (c-di-GMP phosphodiesterase class II)